MGFQRAITWTDDHISVVSGIVKENDRQSSVESCISEKPGIKAHD
jgi:hypothetical protein